ncbi:MAG: hypothetical protein V4615_03670 [Bacteroidota bacterium]
MSDKSKFAIPIAVSLTILGYILLYFLIFQHKWIHVVSELEYLMAKRYTVTVDLAIEPNHLPNDFNAREKLLTEINGILLKRIREVDHNSTDANTGTLSYTISRVLYPNDMVWLLSTKGEIAFYQTFEASEVISYFAEIDKALAKTIVKQKMAEAEARKTQGNASVGDQLFADFIPDSMAEERTLSEVKRENGNPLFEILYVNVNGDFSNSNGNIGEGPIVGRAFIKDTAKINSYLSLPETKQLLPADLKLMWGTSTFTQEKTAIALYAIQQPYQLSEPPLSGKFIKDASHTFSDSFPAVDFSFNIQGSSKWERMTKEASSSLINGRPVKKCIAIVVDNRVFSAPRVQQAILEGKAQVTGIENLGEAINLATIIKSGELPVPVITQKVIIK